MEPRHEKTIELLAHGVSVKKIAAEIGVDERTIRRWKQEPEFALELLEALHDSIDDTSRRVQPTIACAQNATNAVFERLTELAHDPDFKIADRACRTLLSYGFKWATLPLQIQKEKDKLAQKELDRAARQQKSAKPDCEVNEKRTFTKDEVQATPELKPVATVSGADISQPAADTASAPGSATKPPAWAPPAAQNAAASQSPATTATDARKNALPASAKGIADPAHPLRTPSDGRATMTK